MQEKLQNDLRSLLSAGQRPFPIQGPTTHRTIPWWLAEEAYAIYSSRYSTQQSLEELAQRGGFGADELDDLIPGWRDRLDRVKQLEAIVVRLEKERDGWVETAGSQEGAIQGLHSNRRDMEGQLTNLQASLTEALKDTAIVDAIERDEIQIENMGTTVIYHWVHAKHKSVLASPHEKKPKSLREAAHAVLAK